MANNDEDFSRRHSVCVTGWRGKAECKVLEELDADMS